MRTKPSSEARRVLSATTGRNVRSNLTACAGRDSPPSPASFVGQTTRLGQPMMDTSKAAAHMEPRSPMGDI
jgi:hypothetical protein